MSGIKKLPLSTLILKICFMFVYGVKKSVP
jgi:hypothetical protein